MILTMERSRLTLKRDLEDIDCAAIIPHNWARVLIPQPTHCGNLAKLLKQTIHTWIFEIVFIIYNYPRLT